MRSALARALALSLTISALPICAQERTWPASLDRGSPAQSTADDAWLHVRQLPPGEDVRVVLDDATSYRGRFRMADGESVTLQAGEQDQHVSRAKVHRIFVARGTHRRRHVLLGLVIGGATAGLVTALHCRGAASSCNEVAPAYFYPLAGAGVVIGAVLPAREWQEVYRADGS